MNTRAWNTRARVQRRRVGGYVLRVRANSARSPDSGRGPPRLADDGALRSARALSSNLESGQMSNKRIAVATALSCLLATSSPRAQGTLPSIGGDLPTPLPLSPASNWWNLDISGAPVDPSSASFVLYVGGASRRIRADMGGSADGDPILTYGIPYVRVPGSQPKVAVQFDVPEESDGVDHTTETSIPFYPIPDEAKTNPHWIEGGWAGNDADADGDRHILIV